MTESQHTALKAENAKRRGLCFRLMRFLIILALLAPVMALIMWHTGLAIVEKSFPLVGLAKQYVRVEAGFVFGLPFVNYIYGRNLSLTVLTPGGESEVKVGLLKARKRNLNGSAVWDIQLKNPELRHNSWKAGAELFYLKSERNAGLKTARLRDGSLLHFRIEGPDKTLMAADSLAFKELSFARPEQSWQLLDWTIALNEAALNNCRVDAAPLVKKEEPFNALFSASNISGRWSLNWNYDKIPLPESDAPEEDSEKGFWAGLYDKSRKSVAGLKQSLELDEFSISLEGVWPESGMTDKLKSRLTSASNDLFSLKVEGLSPSPSKEEVLEWASGFLGLESAGEAEKERSFPAALASLGFEKLSLTYDDSGLRATVNQVKTMTGQLWDKRPSLDSASPGAVWQKLSAYFFGEEVAGAGDGTLSLSKEGQLFYPFAPGFAGELNSGNIKPDFVPEQ